MTRHAGLTYVSIYQSYVQIFTQNAFPYKDLLIGNTNFNDYMYVWEICRSHDHAKSSFLL